MKTIVERVNQVRVKDNVKLLTVVCGCGCVKWYGNRRLKKGKMTYSYVCIQCGNKETE